MEENKNDVAQNVKENSQRPVQEKWQEFEKKSGFSVSCKCEDGSTRKRKCCKIFFITSMFILLMGVLFGAVLFGFHKYGYF